MYSKNIRRRSDKSKICMANSIIIIVFVAFFSPGSKPIENDSIRRHKLIYGLTKFMEVLIYSQQYVSLNQNERLCYAHVGVCV